MDANKLLFDGMVAVITGAGSGIGRGFAVGFARDGAQVVGISRTKEGLSRTAELCGPREMRCVVGNVAVESDVDRLVTEAMAIHGRVDILVNNAALYPKIGFLESSWTEWTQVIETNVLGMALCCRKFLPGMLERGHGRIINIGTFAWRGPIPGASAYSVSKAAAPVLTKAIASEIDRERFPDVLVNELVPGIYRTRMSDMGDDPMDAYTHVRRIVSLPSGGITGATFELSELWTEHFGIRDRMRRIMSKFMR